MSIQAKLWVAANLLYLVAGTYVAYKMLSFARRAVQELVAIRQSVEKPPKD